MPDELKHLNKEDLFLLMESYRNMITMHSTLAEQQKQIIDLQNNIISKQDSISINQTQSYDQLKVIADKLKNFNDVLTHTNDNINASFSKLNTSVSENKLDLTKQHSGLSMKIYLAMGLMTTIIIGLITLASGLSDKYSILQEVHHMLVAIKQFFGITVIP